MFADSTSNTTADWIVRIIVFIVILLSTPSLIPYVLWPFVKLVQGVIWVASRIRNKIAGLLFFVFKRRCDKCQKADWRWSRQWSVRRLPKKSCDIPWFSPKTCCECTKLDFEDLVRQVKVFSLPTGDVAAYVTDLIRKIGNPDWSEDSEISLLTLLRHHGPYLPKSVLKSIINLKSKEIKRSVRHGYVDDYPGAEFVHTRTSYEYLRIGSPYEASYALQLKQVLASRWGQKNFPDTARVK